MKLDQTNLKGGILKNIRNAQELLDEAEILLNNNRYARAYLLSHLAIEESSKCGMLLKVLAFNTWQEYIDINNVRKRFVNHLQKIQNFKLLEIFTKGDNIDLKNEIIKLSDLKNQSIYVNWSNENEFLMPNEFFDKTKSKALFEKAYDYVKLYTKVSVFLIENESDFFATLLESKNLPFIKELIKLERNVVGN